MKKLLKNLAITLILSFIISRPAIADWELEPKYSSIIFTATQNASPVSGQFKHFTGDINFDPAALNTSHIQITVDTASISTSYKDIETTLKTPEWFNVKIFPKAIFKASQFSKTGDKTYQANGTLTIRDKTIPVILNFTLDEYTPLKAHATGSTVLKRTAFGVGTGEWAKTDNVKDDVRVDFVVALLKKS